MADAVITGGIRTPFVKAGGSLRHTPAQDLAQRAVRELLAQTNVPASEVDQLIAGNVATPPEAANLARVIALRSGIPQDRIAHTVSRNCASGFESITEAITLVETGQASCVVAVGVDSMSNIPLFYGKSATEKMLKLSQSRSAFQKLKSIAGFRPRDFKPEIGLVKGLTDPVSGMIMGDTAEKLAREYDISREAQDEYALRSHQRAATAWNEGRLKSETMTLYPEPKLEAITQDIGPRDNQSMQALAKLKPYFDRRWGTVTVGNACQITDGAVAMLIMDAAKAKSLGIEPIGKVRRSAYAGCDPSRMGLGPVYASAKALKAEGLTLDKMELIELNEAFAAQVLACVKGFAEPPKDCTVSESALGEIDMEKLNVNGGAIALGHPVGATGARLVLTLLHELSRRKQNTGLATLCVGGGQGGALIVECLGQAV